jgi:hypothetical protein
MNREPAYIREWSSALAESDGLCTRFWLIHIFRIDLQYDLDHVHVQVVELSRCHNSCLVQAFARTDSFEFVRKQKQRHFRDSNRSTNNTRQLPKNFKN